MTDWTLAEAVDFSSATIRLDDGAICRGRQCDGFRSITCSREGTRYMMPTLGGLTRTTLISPDLRSSENAVGTIEYNVLKTYLPEILEVLGNLTAGERVRVGGSR